MISRNGGRRSRGGDVPETMRRESRKNDKQRETEPIYLKKPTREMPDYGNEVLMSRAPPEPVDEDLSYVGRKYDEATTQKRDANTSRANADKNSASVLCPSNGRHLRRSFSSSQESCPTDTANGLDDQRKDEHVGDANATFDQGCELEEQLMDIEDVEFHDERSSTLSGSPTSDVDGEMEQDHEGEDELLESQGVKRKRTVDWKDPLSRGLPSEEPIMECWMRRKKRRIVPVRLHGNNVFMLIYSDEDDEDDEDGACDGDAARSVTETCQAGPEGGEEEELSGTRTSENLHSNATISSTKVRT